MDKDRLLITISNLGWYNMLEEQSFRFDNKRRYEQEIARLILIKNKNDSEELDNEYDQLLDEYLKFCAEQE